MSEQVAENRDERQRQVIAWARRSFGDAVADNRIERVLRVLEEALELAQAEGLQLGAARHLASLVFSRLPGKSMQEVGGVSVTLLAYCEIAELSADQCERAEIDRILAKPLEHFRRRQNEKAALGVAMRAQP